MDKIIIINKYYVIPYAYTPKTMHITPLMLHCLHVNFIYFDLKCIYYINSK